MSAEGFNKMKEALRNYLKSLEEHQNISEKYDEKRNKLLQLQQNLELGIQNLNESSSKSLGYSLFYLLIAVVILSIGIIIGMLLL